MVFMISFLYKKIFKKNLKFYKKSSTLSQNFDVHFVSKCTLSQTLSQICLKK